MTELPPLGALLESARKRKRLSQNAAATAAGISGTHWRRVVRGEYEGTAETVAHMARAVGVTPAELEAVDRADAANELRVLDPAAWQRERRAARATRESRAAEGAATLDELRELADRIEHAQQDPTQRAALLAVLRAIQRSA